MKRSLKKFIGLSALITVNHNKINLNVPVTIDFPLGL